MERDSEPRAPSETGDGWSWEDEMDEVARNDAVEEALFEEWLEEQDRP